MCYGSAEAASLAERCVAAVQVAECCPSLHTLEVAGASMTDTSVASLLSGDSSSLRCLRLLHAPAITDASAATIAARCKAPAPPPPAASLKPQPQPDPPPLCSATPPAFSSAHPLLLGTCAAAAAACTCVVLRCVVFPTVCCVPHASVLCSPILHRVALR